jgi:Tfp pilus assembly protein PilP
MRPPTLLSLVFLNVVSFAAAAAAAPDSQAVTKVASEATSKSEPRDAAAASSSPTAQAETRDDMAAYKYSPEGRRDPFLSLVGTGGDSKPPAKRTGEGLAAMRVDDVAVRGIVQSRERLVAMVQGPDNKSYVVHQGDRLADGVVKSVAADALVLVQDVTDPRSKDKTREVRKPLRAPDEGKE